ncbi:MAG: DUF4013 domain-containing protein [Anaerolineales bacterium]|jgi:hypothetical protein
MKPKGWMNLDYAAPFGFFLRDRAWLKKVVLASLLAYTIIGISPVLGWTLEITRRVVRGGEVELPEWANLPRFWKEGIKGWLLNLVWLMPVILAILIIYLPILFMRSIGTNQLAILELAILGCMLTFIMMDGMVAIFLLPAALGILAETGSLRQAINPMHAWRLARAHLGAHFLVFVIFGLGLTTVLSIAALLTLFLALPPLLVYTGMVLAHFSGQLYKLHPESVPPMSLAP